MALPALGWEQSRQQGGGFLLSHPCPLLKGPLLESDPAGRKSSFCDFFFDIYFFFYSALAAPFVTFSFSFFIQLLACIRYAIYFADMPTY